jgi:hypothetical protein
MVKLQRLTLSIATPEQVGYAVSRLSLRDEEDNAAAKDVYSPDADIPSVKDIKRFVKKSKVKMLCKRL